MGYKKERKTSKKSEIETEKQSEQTSDTITKKVFLNDKSTKSVSNELNQQKNILHSIENNNIKLNVVELMKKFNPPPCNICKNRSADRICINKKCGTNKYMSLICGKCHLEEHSKCPKKAEIDIEEFFIKLGVFLNDQQQEEVNKTIQRIDIPMLESSIDTISSVKQKLQDLKQKLLQEQKEKQNMYEVVTDSSVSALSLCEYDNINTSLKNIKECILYTNNKFVWNDNSQKFKGYMDLIRDLILNSQQINQLIVKSFIGGFQISLFDTPLIYCTNTGYKQKESTVEEVDEGIKISTTTHHGFQQYYLDYQLDFSKKYKLRFSIGNQSSSEYVMVGVMQKSKANNTYLACVPEQYFCLSFDIAYEEANTQVLKGQQFYQQKQIGSQFEMRVDFENNHIDFYDFPKIDNLIKNAAKQQIQKSDDYVIAILLDGPNSITLEEFAEIELLDELI